MPTTNELEAAATAARLHAANTASDIQYASTRIEHIRLTALAVEADTLAKNLESLVNRVKSEANPQ